MQNSEYLNKFRMRSLHREEGQVFVPDSVDRRESFTGEGSPLRLIPVLEQDPATRRPRDQDLRALSMAASYSEGVVRGVEARDEEGEQEV